MSSILVVGSVALDTIETPFGRADSIVGGSAVYFSAAASLFGQVQVVGVVGRDYPLEALDFLRRRGVELQGVEVHDGRSFRWGGSYSYDMNSRETLFTELGVFAEFKPVVPSAFRQTEWVFLANIHPRLQLRVLDQVESPRFVACDTMNYWIEGERDALLEVLGRIDMLVVNDAEARELSGIPNLAGAARWIQERGPTHVAIKKGEHGVLLLSDDAIFFAPGYPLEQILDPTGAGDAFAGGLIGHLASVSSMDPETMKRAVVYGSSLGSFACEAFGPTRLAEINVRDVEERVTVFEGMTRFEAAIEVGS